MGSASLVTSKVAQLPRLLVPVVLYTPRDLKRPSNRKIVIPFISYALHCVVEEIRVSTLGAQISSWPQSLMCWGDPCQDSSLAHGVVSQMVNLVCGSEVALSVLPPVCLFIYIKKNAPVMEPGATSASTYCLWGAGAKGHPPAASWGCEHLVSVTSCLSQRLWKLPLHALQTLCLLQRLVALFLCPFSPPVQEEQIKGISHKE